MARAKCTGGCHSVRILSVDTLAVELPLWRAIQRAVQEQGVKPWQPGYSAADARAFADALEQAVTPWSDPHENQTKLRIIQRYRHRLVIAELIRLFRSGAGIIVQ